MKPLTISFDAALEDKVFSELQRDGITCIENAVDPEFLDQLRGQVDGLLDEKGQRYFTIIEPQKVLGGCFAQATGQSGIEEFARALTRRGHSQAAADKSSLYNVLRIIAGDDAAKTAFEFHYDATVLTLLMPIFLPEGPANRAGDLVALPNDRPYRSSTVVNFIEKVFKQNPLAFKIYKWLYSGGKRGVYKMKPGNLYLFWGYRTFHGNLPCEKGAKRATLLFHFGDPHVGDPLSEMVLKIRKKREERRLAAA